MSTVYPSLDSPEYAAAVDRFTALIGQLDIAVTTAEQDPAASGPEVTPSFESVITMFNDALGTYVRTEAFLSGFIAVDSRNAEAQARSSELDLIASSLAKVSTRLTAWLGRLDVEPLLAASSLAREHEYQLRKAKIEADHLMSQPPEELAADLTLSGASAWVRLHNDVSSQIMVPFEGEDGVVAQIPMTELRNLANDPDRDIRKRAFDAELAAWKLWQTPFAAALNGVKGEHTTIASRQQWDSILDQAVFQNGIDREILDAMMSAARDVFPEFRRYFRAKARALGLEQLAFYDLFAPFEIEGREWAWDDAVAFVQEQFTAYSPKMGALVQRALADRWIDVEPRPGKTGGAFCMMIDGDVSRVLLNFTPSFSEVRTLAHELGHAYHNACQAGVSALRRIDTPNTLAETASTFCETILTQAAIAQGTVAEQLSYLESSLQDAAQIVVDISSRFLFEQAVCTRRADRELSADEFCDLMLDAQRQTYGDGLAGDALHPYMWAVKSHYYSSRHAYYNFPYMFGQLFGIGLYARYTADPDGFRASYDDLLASTGDNDAATLAARFGIDLRDRAFWDASLAVITADIDRFEALVNERASRN